MIFQTYPSMNHQINCLPYSLQEKSHPSNILESLVIKLRSCSIRNLPGICLMVAGVHFVCYAHIVYTFLQVNMKYRKIVLNSKVLIYIMAVFIYVYKYLLLFPMYCVSCTFL